MQTGQTCEHWWRQTALADGRPGIDGTGEASEVTHLAAEAERMDGAASRVAHSAYVAARVRIMADDAAVLGAGQRQR